MAAGDDRDPDDWFSEPKHERRRQARTAPARSEKPLRPGAGTAEDWIRDVGQSDGGRARESRGLRALAAATSALILLLIALAAGGVFSSNGGQPAAPPSTTTGAATAPAPTPPVPPKRPTIPPPATTLKPGDTGAQVKALQRALAHLGYPVGAIDGNYGKATQQALASFQRKKGLTADGILGPHTLQALTVALRA